MAVAKIEVMDSRKLLAIAFLAIALQMTFFIIPSYFIPNSIDTIRLDTDKYLTYSYDKDDGRVCNTNNRYQSRSASFHISTNKEQFHHFIFRLPRINHGLLVDYSKWHTKVIGLLTVSTNDRVDHSVFTFWNATLFACRNKINRFYKFGPSFFDVQLNKPFSEDYPPYYPSNYDNGISKYSEIITLLEFEPTLYDEYILIIQSNEFKGLHELKLLQMSLKLTIPNAAFSEFMVYLKTIFFAFAMLFTIWCRLRFYKHVEVFNNREKATFALGIALLCLDIPVEWFTLMGPSDFLFYTKNIRTDVYYAALAVCCLIFVCECVPNTSTGFRTEEQYLTSMVLITLEWCALMILHAYQNYMDICSGFLKIAPYSSLGNGLFTAFFVIIVIAAATYTIYLAVMIRKVLSKKAEISGPPSAASHRQSLRSVFPLMSTLICVLFTLIEFVTCEIVRYQTRWSGGKIVEEPSSLSIGIFSMWNIYTLIMMYLYAPEQDEESTPTATITTITLPSRELMPQELIPPPSYNEYLRSIDADNAAEGSEVTK